jgi:multiple sugar transport system substrate-binding protein
MPVRALLSLLVLALVAACGRSGAPPGVAVISLSVNGVEGGKNSAQVRWLKEMAPRIEEQLGGRVKVRILADGGSDESYKARLVLDLYAGTGADISSFDGFWTAGMASAGLLPPLDSYLAEWQGWAHFVPTMRRMGEYQGHIYLVPFYTDVRGIYYRKDLFLQAGLPADWRPRSWQDILDAGRVLAEQAPSDVIPIQWDAGTSYGEATTMQGLYLLVLSAGGDLFDREAGRWVVGGAPLQRALEFYREIYVTGGLGSRALQLDPRGRERSFELFRAGKIGIYAESSWMWTGVLAPGQTWALAGREERVGWAPMPGADPELPPVSLSGGGGYILNRGSPNLPLAWAVLSRLASREALEAHLKLAPFIPARQDLIDSEAFRAASDEMIRRQVREALPVTTFRPGLPAYPRVSELAQQMVEQVVQGRPVRVAMEEYARRVEALVGRRQVSGTLSWRSR